MNQLSKAKLAYIQKKIAQLTATIENKNKQVATPVIAKADATK
jgi:hypothetical protein